MTKREYVLGFNNVFKSERVVREFLCEKCNTVRFTLIETKQRGGEKDATFLATVDHLRDDFIEKEVDSCRYTIEQGGNILYTHYYYWLSMRMKLILSNKTLLWDVFSQDIPCEFYGFSDPLFCNAHKGFYDIIAITISHEPYINFHLEIKDKYELDKRLRENNLEIDWY